MRTNIRPIVASVLAAALCAAPAAHAADPFYQGKTLNLIVGYSPGGGSDITCRLFAEHMGRYIPGNPTIVVRNMPGAGGSNAMNYVGEAAAADGLTALCGATNPLLQLLKDKALRVDLRKFQYIAGIPDSQVVYVRADVEPGIKQPTDIFNAKSVVFGGFRPTSLKDLIGRLTFDMLGVEHSYVVGIRGDGKGRAHIQQGFIQAWAEGMGSYLSITVPTLVEPKIITPIFQSGMPDSSGGLSVRDTTLPDLPTFQELYKSRTGKDPEGVKWQAYSTIVGVISLALRTVALPQGAPQAAVTDLRAALQPMLDDAAFKAQARKVLGDTVSFSSGEIAQAAFERALSAPEEVKAFMIKYADEGKSRARKAGK